MSANESISSTANATIGRLLQPNRSGRVNLAKLPSNDALATLRPINESDPLAFRSLLNEKTAPITSRRDLFTGTELSAEFVKDNSESTRSDRARQAAEQLVASTLVKPILQSLRESNNAAGPFAPTQADKQFGPLLDAQLADKIVSASKFDLVDRLHQDMLGRQAYISEAANATKQSANQPSVTQARRPLDLLG